MAKLGKLGKVGQFVSSVWISENPKCVMSHLYASLYVSPNNLYACAGVSKYYQVAAQTAGLAANNVRDIEYKVQYSAINNSSLSESCRLNYLKLPSILGAG